MPAIDDCAPTRNATGQIREAGQEAPSPSQTDWSTSCGDGFSLDCAVSYGQSFYVLYQSSYCPLRFSIQLPGQALKSCPTSLWSGSTTESVGKVTIDTLSIVTKARPAMQREVRHQTTTDCPCRQRPRPPLGEDLSDSASQHQPSGPAPTPRHVSRLGRVPAIAGTSRVDGRVPDQVRKVPSVWIRPGRFPCL